MEEEFKKCEMMAELYKLGDYIVLLERDMKYVSDEFIVGNIYPIYDIDYDDHNLPYRIEVYPNSSNGVFHPNRNRGWVHADDIRLAEPFEVDALKYNL